MTSVLLLELERFQFVLQIFFVANICKKNVFVMKRLVLPLKLEISILAVALAECLLCF